MRTPRVIINEPDDLVEAEYYAQCLERGLACEARVDWHTETEMRPPTEAWQQLWPGEATKATWSIDETQVWLKRWASGLVHGAASAKTPEEAASAVAWLQTWLPESSPAEDQVSLRFWYLTQHGPTNIMRRIAVPKWGSVADNYSRQTRAGLAHLMTEFRPSHGGQIILWQGDPGTGKTYALRALFAAWREWCEPEYVVDPDNLFGEKAAYLMQLLIQNDEPGDEEADEGKWRLLVLEDASELVVPDAKDRAGQGLSRLLNLTDGLIGQGLRILVLITTNDDVKALHPAVSRKGRTASIVKFSSLDRLESVAWLKNHGAEPEELQGAANLADLYARLEDPDHESNERPIGFEIAS